MSVSSTRFTPASMAVVAGGLGLLLAVWSPSSVSWIPPCPVRAWADLYCPGCGTLRAAHDLLRLQPVRAVDHNVAMVASLPMLGTLWAHEFIERRATPNTRVLHVYLVALTAFTVARNLPWSSFAMLAP